MNISNQTIQKTIYLAVRLSEKEEVFETLQDMEKISVDDVFNNITWDPLNDSPQKKAGYIAAAIAACGSSILVGHITGLDSLRFIHDALEKEDLRISGIYIPSASRRERQLEEGKQAYGLYNNWLGLAPGEVEENHREREEMYGQIRAHFNQIGIDVTEV